MAGRATVPEIEAVAGELIEFTPSEAEQNAGADRARGRTALQVGIPGALVVIGSWMARLGNLDLDPGAGVDMPANVTAAWIILVTVALAIRMNPKK